MRAKSPQWLGMLENIQHTTFNNEHQSDSQRSPSFEVRSSMFNVRCSQSPFRLQSAPSPSLPSQAGGDYRGEEAFSSKCPRHELSLLERESVTRSSFANRLLAFIRSPSWKITLLQVTDLRSVGIPKFTGSMRERFVSENPLPALRWEARESRPVRMSGGARFQRRSSFDVRSSMFNVRWSHNFPGARS